MTAFKPSYEELESRLAETEQVIHVLQNRQADAVLSHGKPMVLRSKDAVDALHQLASALQNSVEEHTTELRNLVEELEAEIAERRRIEGKLSESESRLRSITEAAPDFIAELDRHGRVQYVNRDDTDQESKLDAPDWPWLRKILADAKEVLDAVFDEGAIRSLVAVSPNKKRSFACCLAPIRNEGTTERAVLIARDITEQYAAQAREIAYREEIAAFGKAQVMAEMGSGLAHELNQPLGAITLHAGLIDKLVNQSDEVDEVDIQAISMSTAEIQQQALRAGNIIRMLRNMSQRVEPAQASLDIANLVTQSLELIDYLVQSQRITVVQNIPSDLPHANADGVQITQVLFNLLKNAIEAMSETPFDQRRLEVSASATDDDKLIVAIRDQGGGLEIEPDRLFATFQTTKPQGMGMGLAISRSIIDLHGGQLRAFRNEDGPGTTFEFVLPVFQEDAD